jgi:hypothetical protein
VLDTPVVLIAFNRPDLTRRTLQAIRPARPTRLFLVCDGPRPERPTDVERCSEVRAALEVIDWDCVVERRFSDENLGCEANVETGLDWVFDQVEAAIVLEDDCVPDPTFYPFAEELLERYRDDRRVWHIAGNSHGVPRERFGEDSYAFSTWASVWGWATWRDRWQRHRATFHRDHVHRTELDRGDAPVRRVPAGPAPGALVTRSAQRHFAKAAASNDVVTHGWDKQWWLTIMSDGGLSVTPAVNLVHNAGFGADATHGVVERVMPPAERVTFPLRHPADVSLHIEVERELELELARVGGRTAQIARQMIRSPMLRRAIRSAVYSGPARRAARHGSKVLQRGRRVGSGPEG